MEKRIKKPRKISPDYLHNAGLYYLQRYASSQDNFRRVMMRKIQRSYAFHKAPALEESKALLENLIKRFCENGLLNDEVYAQGVVRSCRARGKSSRYILGKLKEKGIHTDLAKTMLSDQDEDRYETSYQAEMLAALKHARKKRLPPFSGMKEISFDKALASLARAGFSYDIARKVLDMRLEDAEAMLHDGVL